MAVITIRKKIDSETIHLPELRPLIGKTVEIVVREERALPADAAGWDMAFQAAQELENYDFNAWREQREHDRQRTTDHAP